MDSLIRFISIFYALLIYTTFTNAKHNKFRTPSNTDPRIVGGEETTIDRVPYLINLRRNGQFTCGGSLITPYCVLTAAHCVYRATANSLTVAGGASKLTDNAEMRQVQQTFVSAFYTPSTLDMDVAVLKLMQPLVGTNIATISLCSKKPEDGELVQISGWGYTSETNRQPSEQVRTANVRMVSRAECQQAYGGQATLTSSMFCATIPGQKDSCSGDSGGPVVYRGEVCGIVSWGFGCARPEYPGVYTNVASLRVNAYIRGIVMANCL
ncbi:seminase-like [Musca vetustissima]|uniref:seminase-like n=1 Tax=Musca vetustissima TaxID=27455 RepID=UPI002AB6643C|nr:seminase-like [Musca vetustissima]